MKSYLTFRVGHEWYGIEVDDVIEVLYFVALHELPAAPPEVLGILTLRNMLLPVIDLRRRFGLYEASLKLETPIIAVRTPQANVGLVVDEANTVVDVTDDCIKPANGQFVQYAVRLPNQLFFVLDTLSLIPEGVLIG